MIGSLIVFGIWRTISIFSNNIGIVDDGISLTEQAAQFQKDMEFVKIEYPTFVVSSGSIFGDAKFGYNLYVLEHISGSGGIIIGVASGDSALTWENPTYVDSSIFYSRINEVTKNQIRATGMITPAQINPTGLYRYEWIHPTKFGITPLNNGSWKFEVVTLGLHWPKLTGKNMISLLTDPEILKYNISFIVK